MAAKCDRERHSKSKGEKLIGFSLRYFSPKLYLVRYSLICSISTV